MGWRDSYVTLLELFPQIDARLIKGAALEHGDDVTAAAEFILTDVIGPDEGNWHYEQLPVNNHHGPTDQRSPLPEEEQTVTATACGTSLVDFRKDEYGVPSACSSGALRGSELQSFSSILRLITKAEAQEVNGESSNGIVRRQFFTKHVEIPKKETEMEEERVEFDVTDAARSVHTEPVEEDVSVVENIDSEMRFWEMDCEAHGLESHKLFRGEGAEENQGEGDDLPEKLIAPCDPSSSSRRVTHEGHHMVEYDGQPPLIDLTLDESFPELPTGISGLPSEPSELHGGEGLEFDQSLSEIQLPKRIFDGDEAEELALMFAGYDKGYNEKNLMADEFPVYDGSISVPRSAFGEDDGAVLDDGLDSMLSIQKSAISEEMDRADWENVNSTSIIQLNQMEPLDDLVEVAKADKEALISSIEEIRALRLMTDQAEFVARQSREEAARSGADVMAKVEEMRKMLSRARETNAVHAGEVFGEKAVLATEARELQYRLAEVNSEKAKAVAALNEIKASLQARIESAVQEREAAEQEKVAKELLAKEAMAKEEALVSKVAQESRDLEAEAEACSKMLPNEQSLSLSLSQIAMQIRDFLMERGSIVDALQGEVAVLREDAEALKKDLESMSLSYSGSGFPMLMLSQPGSEIYNSIVSRSSKLSELYGRPADNSVHVEDGASSSGSELVSPSVRSLPGVQKTPGDKKSWSSLPSLLRGLSSSQDLNSSAHSAYSSHASNSLSSSREALLVNQGEKSQALSLENSMMDMKSSTNSSTLPAGTHELELLRTMFEGKELDISGIQNLDIFRTEKPNGSAGAHALELLQAMFAGKELETSTSGVENLDVFLTEKQNGSDEEDWQLLEKDSPRSSSSPCSVVGGK